MKPANPTNERTYDKIPCSCGNHFGVGVWTAEDRAKRYAWYRDKYKPGYDPRRKQWLGDYEIYHGHQRSNI